MMTLPPPSPAPSSHLPVSWHCLLSKPPTLLVSLSLSFGKISTRKFSRSSLNLEFRLRVIFDARSAFLSNGFSKISASSRILSWTEITNATYATCGQNIDTKLMSPSELRCTFSWCSLNSFIMVSSSGSTYRKLLSQESLIKPHLPIIAPQSNCILQFLQLGSVFFCLKILKNSMFSAID